MNKHLIIGLDLSFNSSGMTLITPTGIEFHRLVYQKTPTSIIHINQHTYNLPVNVRIDDIVDDTDFYSEDQALITVKAMVICKRLMALIRKKISVCNPECIYVNIEGFIMSSFSGSQQLRVLGGLIMLQGLIRSELIRLKIDNPNIEEFRIFITSPTTLKKYFTDKGDADKQDMLDSFISFYDGNKLLPDTKSLAKVNDVIDSFALALNCYHRIFHNTSFMELHRDKVIDGKLFNRKPKKKPTKTKKNNKPDTIDLIRQSFNLS